MDENTRPLLDVFRDPPRKYTLVPFWFLNDDLDEAELRRQIDDFADHGVYGFIPHARIGLAEHIGFMSERWLHYIKVCVDYAAQKDMLVILYDEGMYPSGSCAGQVVAANPRHATRCLVRVPTGNESLEDDDEIIARDDRFVYVHTRSLGTIRGVHYGQDDREPGAPPSGDILNPEAVASFLHLVNDRHYEALKDHFGKTVIAIFTDEPDVLGRGHRKDARPWTRGFEDYLEKRLGYDFRPWLHTLWDSDAPEAERRRKDFYLTVNTRLEEVYYKPYRDWCDAHGVALTGHPAGPMDIGTLKYFHIPGQDVVWRYLEPFQDKSLEGPQSTMGKCSASAQVHYGRARNLNECFGAYGWEFTWGEMRWLTNWLFARGVNMLAPHAFYYSIRGKRRDERPPDVGPNNVWWDQYKTYADYCRRVCWLLAEGRQVCRIAILGGPTWLPWRAARVCYERQRDFNYLDTDTLCDRAEVTSDAITVAAMRYEALIIDGNDAIRPEVLTRLQPFLDSGRVIAYGEPVPGVPTLAGNPGELISALDAITPPDVQLDPPAPDIRYHHVRHTDADLYFFANEGPGPVDAALAVAARGPRAWWDPETGHPVPDADPARIQLDMFKALVLYVPDSQ